MLYPTFLKKKDTIGICAPSAGVGKKKPSYEKSLQQLQEHFSIIETKSVRVNNLRSNTSEIRAKELHEVFENKDVQLVLCASGGDFLFEILPYVDFDKLTQNPKWLMGYSDPTSLLYTLTTKYDIATLYGCNGGSYDIHHPYLENNLEIIQGNLIPQTSFDFYQTTEDFIHDIDEFKGKVEWILSQEVINVTGRCIGGCLEVLQNLFNTPYDGTLDFIDKYQNDGIIWYFDVFNMSAETFYLTLLKMKYMNYFKHTKAIIVGRVCFENSDTGMTYVDALEQAQLNIPYIFNADIGHVSPKMTMINGAIMTLHAKDNKGTITFSLD